jgi:hypothetical protein
MASAEISESVIHAITPADCCDQYYAGEKNTDLQCFPTLVDNRFYVSLNSLNQGSTNTVIFNPDQGLSDIVLTLVLPPSTLLESGVNSYFGWAMPDNWGSAMINTMALRVGGSALYYFTQDQLFIDTMTDCEDEGKKNAVSALSGGAILSQASYNTSLSNRIANIYVKMPFNSISALQKTLCLPTDLLTQPIQILITFNRFQDVAYWYGAGDAVPSNLCNQFESASVNFKKTTMQNSEHLLARRENMLENALNYPLRYFAQTTFRTNFTQSLDGSNNQQYNTINLTGFRSGSLKYIDIWARPTEFIGANSGANYNFAKFLSVRLLINGLVMYDAQLNAPMWGLCDKKTPTAFNTTILSTAVGNGSAVASNYSSPWVSIPFAQLCEDVAFRNVVNLGYSIQNSVVNLAVVMEDAGEYELSAAYHYTCSMLFTKNSAEYVF